MGAMASQIFILTIVYSRIYSGAYQRKHQSWNSPVTGEFPAQMASNAERRHYVIIPRKNGGGGGGGDIDLLVADS